MAFLFKKFQEAVKVLAKSPTLARDGRRIQFETDINRLFLYTSYNRLGKNAVEADAEEIINMASEASLDEQQKQVQQNVHEQINTLSSYMDEILLPDKKIESEDHSSYTHKNPSPKLSGLGFAVGKTAPLSDNLNVPETKPLKRFEVSQKLKSLLGYTLEIKPSQIQHKEAGQGLFLDGEAEVGSVIAIYPGVTYSPAYYRYIPGYPRVDQQNPYLITRYDGTVINAQPWGTGDDTISLWDPSTSISVQPNPTRENGLDRVWKMLSKPLDGSHLRIKGEVVERRNPLAFAHFANHPPKGMAPNVMVCPYDFPLMNENKDMRRYVPNISFGDGDGVRMRKFGTFWFKSWKSSNNNGGNNVLSGGPVLKSLVLVATREICDEEILLNYRLSNLKRRPSWYAPVDEEEDRRRWS